MDTEEISEKIANMGAVPKLMKLIVDNADEDIVSLAFRAVTNMCEAGTLSIATLLREHRALFMRQLQKMRAWQWKKKGAWSCS